MEDIKSNFRGRNPKCLLSSKFLFLKEIIMREDSFVSLLFTLHLYPARLVLQAAPVVKEYTQPHLFLQLKETRNVQKV